MDRQPTKSCCQTLYALAADGATRQVLSDANGVSNPSREGIHVPVTCPAEHVHRVPEQRYHPVAGDLENAFRV
jgi:hypothetical protein